VAEATAIVALTIELAGPFAVIVGPPAILMALSAKYGVWAEPVIQPEPVPEAQDYYQPYPGTQTETELLDEWADVANNAWGNWQPEPERRPEPEPAPEPRLGDPIIPPITCTPERSDKFYYAQRHFDPQNYTLAGYTALRQGLINSALPGTGTGASERDGLTGQLKAWWKQYQHDPNGYRRDIYAGWAFQAQRVLYYDGHGLAIYTSGGPGIPDIAVDWSTGGIPDRIEAVEVKFNDTGNPPQMLPQIKQYSAMYGERWLIEVSNLSPTTEAFLQRHGGVRFDHNLYP
jgi:hypothetical protein